MHGDVVDAAAPEEKQQRRGGRGGAGGKAAAHGTADLGELSSPRFRVRKEKKTPHVLAHLVFATF